MRVALRGREARRESREGHPPQTRGAKSPFFQVDSDFPLHMCYLHTTEPFKLHQYYAAVTVCRCSIALKTGGRRKGTADMCTLLKHPVVRAHANPAGICTL